MQDCHFNWNKLKKKNLLVLGQHSLKTFTAVCILLGLFFFYLRAREEYDNHHKSQLFERRQGTQLFPPGLNVSSSPCAGTAPLHGVNSLGATLTAHGDRHSTTEHVLRQCVCCFKGDSVPAPRLSAKSVSALKTSPSRTDVLVLSSTDCCSYLLFL